MEQKIKLRAKDGEEKKWRAGEAEGGEQLRGNKSRIHEEMEETRKEEAQEKDTG